MSSIWTFLSAAVHSSVYVPQTASRMHSASALVQLKTCAKRLKVCECRTCPPPWKVRATAWCRERRRSVRSLPPPSQADTSRAPEIITPCSRNKLVGWGNPRQGNTRLIMHCYSPPAGINNLFLFICRRCTPTRSWKQQDRGVEGGKRRKRKIAGPECER